jgi:hypothetical protein
MFNIEEKIILLSKSIKYIFIDFDKTILKIHSSKLYEKNPFNELTEFTKNRNIISDFADFEFFKLFIELCNQYNIDVHIISFGYKTIIEDYMKYAHININICTPSDIVTQDMNYYDGHKIKEGKIIQILYIIDKYYNSYNEIDILNQSLFIDDDNIECNKMKNTPIKMIYNVSENGFNIDEFNKLIDNLI